MSRGKKARQSPAWKLGLLALLLGVGAGAWFLLQSDSAGEPGPDPVAVTPPEHAKQLQPAAEPRKTNPEPVAITPPVPQVKKPVPGPGSKKKLPTLVGKPGPGPAIELVTVKAGPSLNLAQVIDKVKRSTAYLRVTSSDGRVSEGSGFFGVEPGLVMTNAHVLGMLQPESNPPRSVEVIIHNGTARERKLTAKILGVDPQTDLAVLRVDGWNLPPPLTVQPAKRLRELERVYILGFPFGQTLGKQITVSESSISSLRSDEAGVLHRVQVNGGMHPGNSGGPVVDVRGDVIGVAVSGLAGTQIHFAVPGEFVHVFLNGKLCGFFVGLPYREGKSVKVPYEMMFADPLQRVRRPQVEYWYGSAPSVQDPRPAVNASRQKLTLTYQEGRARGEIMLPEPKAEEVLWFQGGYVTGAGEPRVAQSVPHPLPPPLERKPVRLQYARPKSESPLHLQTAARSRQVSEGAEKALVTHLDLQMVEKVQRLPEETLVQIEYASAKLAFEANGKPAPKNPRLQQAVEQIPLLVYELIQTSAGTLRPYRLNLSRVPLDLRKDVSELHEQIVDSLDAVNLALPNREVKPRETWRSTQTVSVPSDEKSEMAVLDFKCTYEGVRVHNGRQEALITLTGDIHPRSGQKLRFRGKAVGQALFDLGSKQFTEVAVTMLLDMDETVTEGRALQVSGTLDVRLRRDLSTKSATRSAAVRAP